MATKKPVIKIKPTAKPVPASMVAKETAKMKQVKKIGGSANSKLNTPNSSMSKTATKATGMSKKATPSPKKTLPTLAEYKQSAAYKTGSMSYKQYLDSFKARGYK